MCLFWSRYLDTATCETHIFVSAKLARAPMHIDVRDISKRWYKKLCQVHGNSFLYRSFTWIHPVRGGPRRPLWPTAYRVTWIPGYSLPNTLVLLLPAPDSALWLANSLAFVCIFKYSDYTCEHTNKNDGVFDLISSQYTHFMPECSSSDEEKFKHRL